MPYRFSYGTIEKYRDHDNVLNDIYRLRYQVYVNEWGFERPQDHPEGLEFDEFDDHSVHIYARSDAVDQVIGSVRMVLDSPLGFPLERHFDISDLPGGNDRKAIAEISRLAISKDYRRRAIDRKIFGLERAAPNQIPRFTENGRDFRRHCEHLLLRGLYLNIFRDSKLRGITHLYAVMAKGLPLILKRWGIFFVQIGPEKDYHGIRAPYLVSLENIARSWEKMDPVLYCEAHSGLMH